MTESLDRLFTNLDRAGANLARLEAVWTRAEPHIPTGPSAGSSPEYETLRRHWDALLRGLPPINGWKITESLPDIDSAGRTFLDYAEIGEHPFQLMQDLELPGQDLARYRFELEQARRVASRGRIRELIDKIDLLLAKIIGALPSKGDFSSDESRLVRDFYREIDRLLGGGTERRGRWYNMGRHLHFSEAHDWREIHDDDWPDVKAHLEEVVFDEFDPLPVDDIDLGVHASQNPWGGVSTKLNWSILTPGDFERLLYDLLRGLPDYQNVQWLMNTNAPDRGRDISLERVVRDSSGTTRTERVIVQAKHLQSKSIGPQDISGSLSSLSLWEPPVIRHLIVATSGRFSSDAVGVVEKHNNDGKMPLVEMWPDSRLEALIARTAGIAEQYHLRD